MGRDQSAAVGFGFAILEGQSELDGEPEEPCECLGVLFAGIGCSLAEALQEVRKDRMRMQGHVAEDIVEDVGFGNVVERFGGANRDGGGKAPFRE